LRRVLDWSILVESYLCDIGDEGVSVILTDWMEWFSWGGGGGPGIWTLICVIAASWFLRFGSSSMNILWIFLNISADKIISGGS